MSIVGLILTIQQVVGLIQRGLSTAKAVADVVDAGRMAVTGADDAPLTGAQVIEHVDAAIAKSAETGDAAAARLESRPRGDGTGEP